jgi:hypothetical protein
LFDIIPVWEKNMTIDKKSFEDRPDIVFIIQCLERALKTKDELAVSVLVTRLERAGLKVTVEGGEK